VSIDVKADGSQGWSCCGQDSCFEELVGLGEGPGREDLATTLLRIKRAG